MKVVIAMDSFKGSMSSMEAGLAARAGVLRAVDAQVVVKPLADGGEGTTRALVDGLGGEYVSVRVSGPLGEPVTAKYGILPGGRTAVMEMAEAAGLALLPRESLDPWRADTRGVGEMILDALGRGCREFVVGIGGSATTEGGIGMLRALGWRFFDSAGGEVRELRDMDRIASIDGSGVAKELGECRFSVACDVKNPLLGRTGAAYVYGPQKGLGPGDLHEVDMKLAGFASAAEAHFHTDNWLTPGAGAAGGLGFAFLSFLPGTRLLPGARLVMEAAGIEEELRDADIVVTGEGRLDYMSTLGKAPVELAKLAKRHGALVLAFAGGIARDAGTCIDEGIDAFFPIVREAATLDEAMDPKNAAENMELAVEQVFRLIGRQKAGGRA